MKACIFNVTVKCVPGCNSLAAHQLNQFVPITGRQVPTAAQQPPQIYTHEKTTERCTGVYLAAVWSLLVQQAYSNSLPFFHLYLTLSIRFHNASHPAAALFVVAFSLTQSRFLGLLRPRLLHLRLRNMIPARRNINFFWCCCCTFRLVVCNCTTRLIGTNSTGSRLELPRDSMTRWWGNEVASLADKSLVISANLCLCVCVKLCMALVIQSK